MRMIRRSFICWVRNRRSKKVGKSLSSDFVQSEVIEGEISAMDFAKNFGIRELLLRQARQLSNN